MAPEMMTVTNNPNVSRWTLENGYENGYNANDYPIRIFNAKQGAAIVILLRLFESDLEYLCKGPIQGFKVILHTPGLFCKVINSSLKNRLFHSHS